MPDSPGQRQGKGAKREAILFFATWFFLGRLPLMPGTWGTMGAIPLYLLLSGLDSFWYGVVLLLLVPPSLVLINRAASILRGSDPPSIVLDEVMGFLVAMWGIPNGNKEISMGFFLFRLFDILKPYPIKVLERIRGGILWDDLMAGIYTNITIRVLTSVLG